MYVCIYIYIYTHVSLYVYIHVYKFDAFYYKSLRKITGIQSLLYKSLKQNIILRHWEHHMRYDELNPIIVEAAQERLF